MTENVSIEDTIGDAIEDKGILCHFNLAFEKDWEVTEELRNRI